MKSQIFLLQIFLLVWGCPNPENDDHNDEHDAGHVHHDDDHLETADAGTVNQATDAGTAVFELPAGDSEVIALAGEHSDDYSNHVVTTTGWFMLRA